MTGVGGHRGRVAFGIAICLAAALVPPSRVGATGHETTVLPGTTLVASTVDLDGDGEEEVVRITGEAGARFALDAWRHDGAAWSTLGSVPVPSRAPEPDRPDTSDVDAAALLEWHAAGRDRLLLLSALVDYGDPYGATCCLAISEVELAPGSGPKIRFIQEVGGGAQSMQAADIDGDGSEDLVLHEMRTPPGEETAVVTVLRWSGSRFQQAFQKSDEAFLQGYALGETDGVDGKDLIVGPGVDGRIRRLAWADGTVRQEEASVGMGGPDGGWISGIADGSIVISLSNRVTVMRWARGEPPAEVSQSGTLVSAGITVVGEGKDALLVAQDHFALGAGRSPTTTVLDLALRPLGEVASSDAAAAFWELVTDDRSGAYMNVQRSLYPYIGPLYGLTVDGGAAYVAGGVLIRPGGPDGYEARPMASLIGVQPTGLAGPGDGWVVVGDSFGGPTGTAYLTGGGMGPGWGRLALVPLAQLLKPDADAELATIRLRNAVETDGRQGGAPMLLADGEGFEAAVTAVPGSTVVVVNGSRVEQREAGETAVVVQVTPRPGAPEGVNQDLETTILVIGPDGRGMARHWTGTFVREAPEIKVSGATDALSLSATLQGRASPGASVTADGRAVSTDLSGGFTVGVDAPIWPSRVLVTARDQLGNEVVEVVEVVGVLDYRGLPWAVMLVLATLVAGGVLYVRTPKRRPTAKVPADDGRLEELELDAID